MKTLKQYTTLLVKSIKLLSWPVGSVYTSSKSTDPHELFGGTWKPIQDVFLYCAGPKHAAGETGGEETHTLTIGEMPEHAHGISSSTITGAFNIWWSTANNPSGCFWGSAVTHNPSKNSSVDNSTNYYDTINFGSTHSHSIYNAGGGAAHNNMPPFRAVYAWERVK